MLEMKKAIVSDLPDAILVLTTCSALINYLGIKLLNNPSQNNEESMFVKE